MSNDLAELKSLTSRMLVLRVCGIVVGLILIAIAIGYLASYASWDTLIERENELQRLVQDYPAAVFLGSILGYTMIAALSIPVATVMAVTLGWFLGFWQTLVIVSFGSTAGATLAFLSSRFLFRHWVEKRLELGNSTLLKRFEQDGPFFLFTLRLTPMVPYFLINLLMGLTKIKTLTFWWVSQIGMLPANAVFSYAGASMPSLKTISENGVQAMIDWRFFFALSLLALVPITLKIVGQLVLRQVWIGLAGGSEKG